MMDEHNIRYNDYIKSTIRPNDVYQSTASSITTSNRAAHESMGVTQYNHHDFVHCYGPGGGGAISAATCNDHHLSGSLSHHHYNNNNSYNQYDPSIVYTNHIINGTTTTTTIGDQVDLHASNHLHHHFCYAEKSK